MHDTSMSARLWLESVYVCLFYCTVYFNVVWCVCGSDWCRFESRLCFPIKKAKNTFYFKRKGHLMHDFREEPSGLEFEMMNSHKCCYNIFLHQYEIISLCQRRILSLLSLTVLVLIIFNPFRYSMRHNKHSRSSFHLSFIGFSLKCLNYSSKAVCLRYIQSSVTDWHAFETRLQQNLFRVNWYFPLFVHNAIYSPSEGNLRTYSCFV